jgi:VWFA-related protein
MKSSGAVRRVLLAGILISALAGVSRSDGEKPAGKDPHPLPVAPGIQREKVSLVLLDVVVTDASGRPLNDLRADDFTLMVDGHRVPIRSVELQIPGTPAGAPGQPPEAPAPAPRGEAQAPAPNLPPAVPRPRGIVLFFDGLNSEHGLGPEPIASARRFLKEGLQPGDEVMLIGLGHVCRIYLNFTPDLSLAMTAMDEIEKDPNLRMGGENHFWQHIEDLKDLSSFDGKAAISLAQSFVTEDLRRASRLTSALEALADFLKSRPGRKEVFLLSDGFAPTPGLLYGIDDDRDQVSDLLRVAQVAASSETSLNTLNTQGMPGDPPGSAMDRLEKESTKALSIFAVTSGGVLTHGVNGRFERPMRAIEEQTRSSYLLTYAPEGEPDGKLHPVRVSVKRKGAQVRAGEGFVWRTEAQQREAETVSAYFAPDLFRKIPLALEASSYLGQDGKPRVELAIALPRSTLLFLTRGDRRVARLEVGVVLNSASGGPEKPINRAIEVRLPASDSRHGVPESQIGVSETRLGISETRLNGAGAAAAAAAAATSEARDPAGDLTLLMRRSIPAGEYEATTVVRDLESGEVGALRTTLKVPALAPDHLAMSSLILSSLAVSAKPIEVDPPEKGEEILLATPSVRRIFARDERVAASSLVYHPRRDPATGEARVTAIAQIQRGQQVIRHLTPARHTLETHGATTTLTLTLPVDLSGLEPGVYRLEVEAWDEVDRHGVLQNVDFQVR